MSYAYYECGICKKLIELEETFDARFDDSGEYHYECYQDWLEKSAREALADYRPSLSKHELDAYEPGSAKRYALELELSGN